MLVNTKFCPSSANVGELKVFLKQHGLSNAGNKQELVQRCCDYLKTEELEEEIDARAFVDFLVERAPGFDVLPMQWTSEGLPVMHEHTVCSFLKAKGAYTKNYRTGLRLCRCGHLSHIQKSASQVPLFIRARCRPTMKRQPPHYECFIQLAEVMACNEDESTKLEIEGANCHCPAGETQSCLHVEPCGIYISEQYLFLGASPEGIVHGEDSGAKLVEVKCPFKHRDKTIEEACHDPTFCIELKDGVFQLKRHHHYYYQVTGQLGITGVSTGYFVVWTQADIFIEEIVLDKDVWSTMQDTLKHFYYDCFGSKILDRLCTM